MPSEIADAIVPMTTAINPGDWYTRLVGYKNGNEEFQLTIVALVDIFIETHGPRIERFLGGAPDIITIVPSTSVPVERQPLWRTLHKVEQPDPRLGIVLRHRPARVIGRSLYRPSAFKVDETAVAQKRVLLIEDLRVSGATAVSAAGSLIEAGAHTVAVRPIARELRPPGRFPRANPWYYVERNGTYNVHDRHTHLSVQRSYHTARRLLTGSA